ncbi:MAG: hypothetical protein KTR30_05765 [Saprospiraceae bacterium]|nr:hypothetical protein [Saprospiraceae bacterium]
MKRSTLIFYLTLFAFPLISNAQEATFSLRERTAYPGNKIYVDVTIYATPGPDNSFWIGTFPENAPLDRLSSERISYRSLKNQGTFQISIQVPGTAGSYDFRLVHNGKVIKREKFKVLEYGAKPIDLKVLTPNIQPEQEFQVKLIINSDFPRTSRIGIYHYSPEKSERQDGYLSSKWYYSRDEENVLRFKAPNKDGVYELRFFTPSPKRKMITRVLFVVGNGKIPAGENKEEQETESSDDTSTDNDKPNNKPSNDQERDCTNNRTKLLEDQACEVTFTLPHPTKDPVFIQKPTFKRDEVPQLWADISQYLINALAAGNATAELKNSLRGREYLQATLNGIEYFKSADNLIVTGFDGGKSPTTYSDMSGGVIAFYLSALKASANGISGIGEKLNNMSMDVYWEVPYISYSGKCVPQMVCKNGEWQPDFKNLKWVEMRKGSAGVYNGHKPNLSSRAVAEIYEAFESKVNQVAKDAQAYKPKGNNCYRCELHLLDVKWPIEDIHCTNAKDKLALAEKEYGKAGKKVKALSDQKKEWDRWGKKNTIKKVKAENVGYRADKAKLEAKISTEEKLIPRIKNVLKNYENSGLTDSKPYKEKQRELAEVNGRITALKNQLSQINIKIAMNIIQLDELEKGFTSKDLGVQLAAAQKAKERRYQDLKEARSYVKYICDQ